MSLEMTFLGHSGFVFSDGTHRLAVDPFLTGNPVATINPQDIACDYIALTHAHADHFGDTLDIAANNDATVIAVYELCDYCTSKGVAKTEPGNPGGRIYTDFGYVAFTPAFHSSSIDGQYMGQPCGLVIEMGDVTVYHAGDTALFGDMKMIGEIAQPDIALLPCGDRFTMGPELAAKAAELIQPKIAVPIHHSTWPLLTSDLTDFTPEGVEVKVLEPGEVWRYTG